MQLSLSELNLGKKALWSLLCVPQQQTNKKPNKHGTRECKEEER